MKNGLRWYLNIKGIMTSVLWIQWGSIGTNHNDHQRPRCDVTGMMVSRGNCRKWFFFRSLNYYNPARFICDFIALSLFSLEDLAKKIFQSHGVRPSGWNAAHHGIRSSTPDPPFFHVGDQWCGRTNVDFVWFSMRFLFFTITGNISVRFSVY